MFSQQLPLEKRGDKIFLTGPIFLSCGCGNVTARWASVQQNLATKIPQAKPKASIITKEWLIQEKLKEKYEILNKHQYGVVVAETENGFDLVDIMLGAAPKMAEQVGQLLRRHKEWKQKQSLSS